MRIEIALIPVVFALAVASHAVHQTLSKSARPTCLRFSSTGRRRIDTQRQEIPPSYNA